MKEQVGVHSYIDFHKLKIQVKSDQHNHHQLYNLLFDRNIESDHHPDRTLELINELNLIGLSLNVEFKGDIHFYKLPLLLNTCPQLEKLEFNYQNSNECRHGLEVEDVFMIGLKQEFILSSRGWVFLIHKLINGRNNKTDIIEVRVMGSLKYFQDFIDLTQKFNPIFLQNYKFNLEVKDIIDDYSLKDVEIHHLSLKDFKSWTLFENVKQINSLHIKIVTGLGEERFLNFIKGKKMKFLNFEVTGGITKLNETTTLKYLSSLSLIEFGEVYINKKASEVILTLARSDRVLRIFFKKKRADKVYLNSFKNNPKIKVYGN